MPNIIFNLQYVATEYFKGTVPKGMKEAVTEDMINYYDRDEACDKTIVPAKIKQTNTDEAFDYYNYRMGSTGGFSRDGFISDKTVKENLEKYKPEIMYRTVFSFEDDFTIENGIKSKASIQKLMQKTMERNLKVMGFDNKNVEWMGYYHTNTAHPHVHVIFYEKDRTKKRFMLSKDKLEKVKSNIVNLMELNVNLFVQRDEVKLQIMNEAKELKLSDALKEQLGNSFNNKIGVYDLSNELLDEFNKLNDILPKTGSMKFNSANIKDYRNDVLKVVELIKNEKNISTVYDEFIKQLDNELQQQVIVYGGSIDDKNKQLFKEKQIHAIDVKLANLVLSNIKDFRSDLERDLSYDMGVSDLEASLVDETSEVEKHINETDEGSEFSKHMINKKSNSIKRSRTNNLFHGATFEFSKAIQQSVYSQKSMQRKADEAVRNAREEIKGKSI
ncbi:MULTISPECIES: relaxase MobL [unclassified Breznakia]|uniref:relaxase MobL n=1 Tax=unclassified Breznakia TaxID=2623764 RepID=UPI002475BD06|nr:MULTISPECIES: relaxase MobL [unclassified Breznakia]MDH6367400.1 hypothetical protein [Breznakia sp. PH1-1]MDH6403932.1 hypothetical protein [Breznakia sp. PF1-11]MDH6411641.1 hypothetical protein [Breznakia sp. PFB1-11]MDH6414567.1 hypothetical protein [Breznakia sp. PFB1-14]MDH6418673.1 hypothetical protein [Breznakia sp. PFB1-12]